MVMVYLVVALRPRVKDAMNAFNQKALIDKISELPEDRIAEIEDFVDFIREREAHRSLVRAAAVLSAPAFARVWDNPEDDVYNDL